jgi:hypothetical protein
MLLVMKRPIKWLYILIIIPSVIIVLFIKTQYDIYYKERLYYWDQIKTEYPKLDDDNITLWKSIPLPNNTKFVLSRPSGPEYGRWYNAYYLTSLSIEEIENYYYQYFNHQLGWEKIGNEYSNSKECVAILALTNGVTNEEIQLLNSDPGRKTLVEFFIWRDFFTQDYSVPTPVGIDLCYDSSFCHHCP